MTLYLDHNATSPVDPRVCEVILRCMRDVYGNASSLHAEGRRAKQLVHEARDAIGAVVGARRHEVVFTSGATEANNLAILGLEEHGRASHRRHIVSTQIEHKAVLEPIDALRRRGFEISLVRPESSGAVDAKEVAAAVRPDTFLVSMMQVNNETGVRQPIDEVADRLVDRDVLFHVDAAQGFGKELSPLRHERIDLISVSAHKIAGPQGIGALIVRRPGNRLPPLNPLMYGGGQELGLRPGTLPVPLIAGFGHAAKLALEECTSRATAAIALRTRASNALAPLRPVVHGDAEQTLHHVLNVSFPGWDADTVLERIDHLVAASDGAACTSVCATTSHVLAAMGVGEPLLSGAIRLSWSYLTDAHELHSALEAVARCLESTGPPIVGSDCRGTGKL